MVRFAVRVIRSFRFLRVVAVVMSACLGSVCFRMMIFAAQESEAATRSRDQQKRDTSRRSDAEGGRKLLLAVGHAFSPSHRASKIRTLMKHGGTMSKFEYLSALKLSNGRVQQVEVLSGLVGADSEAELGQQSSLASQPARSTRQSEFAGNQTSKRTAAIARRKYFTPPQNTEPNQTFKL